MSYVKKALGADESVVLKAKVSILAFLGSYLAILVFAYLTINVSPRYFMDCVNFV